MTTQTSDISSLLDEQIQNITRQVAVLETEKLRLTQARELLTGVGGSDLAAMGLPRPGSQPTGSDGRKVNRSGKGSHSDQVHAILLTDPSRDWHVKEVMEAYGEARQRTANALNKAVGQGLLKRVAPGTYRAKKLTQRTGVTKRVGRGRPSMSEAQRLFPNAEGVHGRRKDGTAKNTGARSELGIPYHQHVHELMLESPNDEWSVDDIFEVYQGPHRQSLLNALHRAKTLGLIKHLRPGAYAIRRRKPLKRKVAKTAKGRKDMNGPDGDPARIAERQRRDRERKRAARRGMTSPATPAQKKKQRASSLSKAREALAAKRAAGETSSGAKRGKTGKRSSGIKAKTSAAAGVEKVETPPDTNTQASDLEKLSIGFLDRMTTAQQTQDDARAAAKGLPNGKAHAPIRRRPAKVAEAPN